MMFWRCHLGRFFPQKPKDIAAILGGTCDPYAVCDHSNWLVDRRGGVARGQAGQESLESCDEPQGVVGSDRETKKQSCGVAASPRVKRRSVATGSGEKTPWAIALNESTSPGVYISQQPNCHMKNSNLYRVLQARESSHFHGPFPKPGAILWGKQTHVQRCSPWYGARVVPSLIPCSMRPRTSF